MADKTFQLEVITPDRCAVEGEMSTLQLTASDGMMGVLAGHAPLISMLGVGPLSYRDTQGTDTTLAVGEGFVEVLKNQVKVLCEFAEFPKEIDLPRAEKALDRAKERLSHRKDADIDEVRAEAAMRRAMVRLKLGGRG